MRQTSDLNNLTVFEHLQARLNVNPPPPVSTIHLTSA